MASDPESSTSEVIKLKGWQVNHVIHVTPMRDRVEHTLEVDCVCEPEIEYQTEPPKAITVTHHALDGRLN